MRKPICALGDPRDCGCWMCDMLASSPESGVCESCAVQAAARGGEPQGVAADEWRNNPRPYCHQHGYVAADHVCDRGGES